MAFITSHNGTTLPVEFANVTATREHNDANIRWQAANQSDLASFDVQSKVGEEWTTVGSVSATAKDVYNWIFVLGITGAIFVLVAVLSLFSAAFAQFAMFSIMIDCRRILDIWLVTMRATTSLAPPGGNGTITVIGLDG